MITVVQVTVHHARIATIAVAIVRITAGCGDEIRTDTTTALDVYVDDARVDGAVAADVEVRAHPPGTLVDGEPIAALLTFTANERRVAIGALHFAAEVFHSAEGGPPLGVSGICGRAWLPDGSRVVGDPCAAVSVAGYVEPEHPITVSLTLHQRTEAGIVSPGRYDVTVPLGVPGGEPDGMLHLAYDVAPRDEKRLPAWGPATASLGISLEEMPAAFFDDPPPRFRVRIEDPYRRAVDERAMADVLRAGPASPVYRTSVPAGAWRIVPLLPGPSGDLVRCGHQHTIIDQGEQQVITLLVATDRAGRCPRPPPTAG